MKLYRLLTLLMIVLLCFAAGVVFAQDATQPPSAARPALVACVEGATTPCVQNVEQAGDIVGTWRSYIRDSSGLHFGFTVYKTDGSIAITSDPQTAPTGIGSITFANEIATLTTSSTDTTNCVNPGSYEIRLIRMGDQPVALTYHALNQATNDICFGRVGGFSQAMLYYPGTGKDLTTLDPKTDALAQPLVPCLGLPRPCDVIATNLSDIKGLCFGSMPLPDPAQMAQTIGEALRLANLRGVLQAGWGGLAHEDEHLITISDAPHDWLFPRMAAIVHHGGSGTTHSALRAGKPALIVPFMADQAFWGRRLVELGVGVPPIAPKKLTPARLAAALRTLMQDGTMRQRAAELGALLRAEDGLAATCELIISSQ